MDERHVDGNALGGLMLEVFGREMTAASDLDLIFLYDFDERAAGSDGERPLPGVQYFTRLTQRLLAALSANNSDDAVIFGPRARLRSREQQIIIASRRITEEGRIAERLDLPNLARAAAGGHIMLEVDRDDFFQLAPIAKPGCLARQVERRQR